MAFSVDNATIRSAIAARGWGEPAPGVLHLMGLRLCVPWADAPDDGKYYLSLAGKQFNHYTSTIGLFGTAFGTWLGSVDPGDDYTYDPANPAGCAHLTDGVWLYQAGLHKGHDALVQAGPVTVWRDTDKDFAQDAGEPLDTGWFGINIHAGGTGETIDDWSAGCQILQGGWDGDPWQNFLATLYGSGRKTWNYYLFSGAELAPGPA
jgi:hypothetical protein